VKNLSIGPALALVLLLPVLATATEATKPLDEVVARGLGYLRDNGQNEDGTLSPRIGSGVTSLVVTAALRHGRPLDDPLVARGLEVRPAGWRHLW
jgi:hypothetical protein